MAYITFPDAPAKDVARTDAERLAEALRLEYGYAVEINESIRGLYEVRVIVPFRTVRLSWAERHEKPGESP